ncbi:MAG: ABC transporter ATP-binding protein [Oscillospiraceae bacterium]|nr:ABC transporter ATP-binding protein [Oscillospiraceae bacterium]
MSNYENAIEIKGLTKKYDGFTLDDISFDVPKGSVMGFIGQNGAGKTTTIKAIFNIISRDAGTIKGLGLDNIENEYEIKEDVAAVFDELPFHEDFNAKQISIVLSSVFKNWDNEKFKELLTRFALPEKKKIKQFSKGMKMKLQIATALSHDAKLLIMDEATTGLDPVVRNEILDIFREYLQDGERSILMSSHITSDLEKIADCVTFIDKGKILLSGYKDDILDTHGLLKCSKADYENIDKEDIISARITDFGVDAMVSDREMCNKKYSGAVIDKTTLEEIMLFYVNRDKKEWN